MRILVYVYVHACVCVWMCKHRYLCDMACLQKSEDKLKYAPFPLLKWYLCHSMPEATWLGSSQGFCCLSSILPTTSVVIDISTVCLWLS